MDSPTPPVTPIPSPYLTSREAAQYLNLSYSRFRKLAPFIKRARTGRFHVDDLNAYAQGAGRVRRLRSRQPAGAAE